MPGNGGSGTGYASSPDQLAGGARNHWNLAGLPATGPASLEASNRRVSRSSPFLTGMVVALVTVVNERG